ncbi:hypothetical protein Tco_0272511 [Tanacetum coccineum]
MGQATSIGLPRPKWYCLWWKPHDVWAIAYRFSPWSKLASHTVRSITQRFTSVKHPQTKGEEKRAIGGIGEGKAKLQMKGYYDAKVRGVSFRPGDFVYRANDASHAEDTGKLGPKWEGPYEVTEALGKGAYKLRDMDGRELPRTWNICNLKKCYL